MLPDYSETKRLFGRFFQTYARRKARAVSPFAAVQTRYLHEGRGMKVMRADETESNTEGLMMCLVRSNLKQTCQELWPDFTRIGHERVTPDQPWQFGLYRTGDEATNETQIYPSTVQWSDLQEICREHAAVDVPAALKADPLLLLLFVNIFPFRASFSAAKFLHKEFDGTWSL